MDQTTIQTLIEGGILVTLIFLGDKLIGVLRSAAASLNDIANSARQIAINTTNPPTKPGPKGDTSDDNSTGKR